MKYNFPKNFRSERVLVEEASALVRRKNLTGPECVVLGEAHFQRNRIEEALRHYEEAARLGMASEDLSAKIWWCSMLLGDFEHAWEETDRTEARRKARGDSTRHLPRHLQRVWNGTPLARKRVLVRCYHGLGDTIQFSRYLPMLSQIAESVILQCQPRMAPLLRRVSGINELVLLDSEPCDPSCDAEIELMELAYAFRTTIVTIPPLLCCLAAQEMFPADHNSNTGLRRIGLVWFSGDWNPERNIPLEEFAPLAKVPSVQWFRLQREVESTEMDEHCPELHLVSAEKASGSVLDTAAVIASLDLVISADTMVAHLAGTLGKPVWTLQ